MSEIEFFYIYMYIVGDFIGKSIKVHLYWAMKNCSDCPDTLRSLITNISNHYQVLLQYIIIIYTHVEL